MKIDVAVYDGKYRVIVWDDGQAEALRYDEPWRDLTGNHLVCSLAQELRNTREELARLKKLKKHEDEIRSCFRGWALRGFEE